MSKPSKRCQSIDFWFNKLIKPHSLASILHHSGQKHYRRGIQGETVSLKIHFPSKNLKSPDGPVYANHLFHSSYPWTFRLIRSLPKVFCLSLSLITAAIPESTPYMYVSLHFSEINLIPSSLYWAVLAFFPFCWCAFIIPFFCRGSLVYI